MYLTITQLVSLYLIIGLLFSIPTTALATYYNSMMGGELLSTFQIIANVILITLFYPVVITYLTFKVIQAIRDCN